MARFPRIPGLPGLVSSRALLGILVFANLGCEADRPAPPNVVLIVIDTLRADHVGCYGSERPTTPAIDALAAGGIRFDRAYSTSPWTLPSATSILTGRYPSGHAVRTKRNRIPPDVPVLADILAAHGYATAAVVSHVFVGSDHGFDRGFQSFDESEARGHEHLSTAGVTGAALRRLEELAGSPFFLFVHYFDPHYTYLPYEGADFAAASAGRLTGRETIQEIRKLAGDLTVEELDFVRALYDEEIRRTDDGVGRILEALDSQGLARKTVVIVTADHGEEFLEHGKLGHGRTLYEELLRVPLVIRVPGSSAGTGSRTVAGTPAAGGRSGSATGDRGEAAIIVDVPVSNVAVVPTVLDLLGIDLGGNSDRGDRGDDVERGSRARFQAASLRPLWEGAPDIPDPIVLAETDWDSYTRRRALVGEAIKVIVDLAEGNRVELYDLHSDREEHRDLAREQPQVADALRRELFDRLGALHPASEAQLDRPMTEERLELLRGLGYVD